MILLLDNHDSFTYNLVHYFQCLHHEVKVLLSDEATLEAITHERPSHLVISPGPNGPQDAGISLAAIAHFQASLPILGVCLGHQCLAQAFGGHIVRAPKIMHGKTSRIQHSGLGLFKNIPQGFNATRYHSLVVEPESLPTCFRVDAVSDNTIMAITHRQYPLYGVQFHPEAILSEHGLTLLENFIHHAE